jgi:hypothetical protein
MIKEKKDRSSNIKKHKGLTYIFQSRREREKNKKVDRCQTIHHLDTHRIMSKKM